MCEASSLSSNSSEEAARGSLRSLGWGSGRSGRLGHFVPVRRFRAIPFDWHPALARLGVLLPRRGLRGLTDLLLHFRHGHRSLQAALDAAFLRVRRFEVVINRGGRPDIVSAAVDAQINLPCQFHLRFLEVDTLVPTGCLLALSGRARNEFGCQFDPAVLPAVLVLHADELSLGAGLFLVEAEAGRVTERSHEPADRDIPGGVLLDRLVR